MADLKQIDLKVLDLVVDCKTNAEIAEEIGYSERQVKRIIKRLFKYYQTAKRIELVKFYIISQFDKK